MNRINSITFSKNSELQTIERELSMLQQFRGLQFQYI